jgi:hypothetical protein
MARWPRSRLAWLAAVACGLAAVALCLAPVAAVSQAGGQARGGLTFDPDVRYETRMIGPSQQFEVRLRLVLPRNVQGYSIGYRRAVDSNEASMARFLRLSARLPGREGAPRPYLEFSFVTRAR